MQRKTLLRVGVPVVAVVAIAAVVIPRLSAQDPPGWINQDDNWTANKQTLAGVRRAVRELAGAIRCAENRRRTAASRRHGSRWASLLRLVGRLLAQQADVPFRSRSGARGPAVARLTPEGGKILKAKADQLARTGGEYDPSATAGRRERRAGSRALPARATS